MKENMTPNQMACSRANLRAIGWQDGDFDRAPIITVASPWSTANPCNWHHRELTDLLVAAIERRGGKVVPTVAIKPCQMRARSKLATSS